MRPGSWREVAWVAGGSAAVAAVAAVTACLPNLAGDPLCGNGIIDGVEQCDPGNGGTAVPGCTGCMIDCDGGYHDPSTDHCYFQLSPLAVPNVVASSPQNGCAAPSNGAHVVTFVDQGEVDTLADNLTIGGPYWIGLTYNSTLDGGAEEYTNEDPSQPGWAPATACPGCFGEIAPLAGGGQAPTFPPASADAGTGCVIANESMAKAWNGAACTDLAIPLCERAPVGSRSVPCNGSDWCIQVRATSGQKSYVYHPSSIDPVSAKAYCAGLSPPGVLVIFDSPAEREELLHELLDLPGGSAAPLAFWIGLSRPATSGGDWAWEDGTPVANRALPWGIGAPESGSARAFVVQQTGNADTQLTHSYARGSAQLVCQQP